MARYRRRRSFFKRRSGRWSANIQEIEDNATLNAIINGSSVDLCLNPIQNNITVSQQYTVKNIELSVYLEATNNSQYVEDVQHYIMYVPQGMNLTTDYPKEHPEYIMAYYYQGNPFSDTTTDTRLKIRSRMARRLQTGDKIIYFWKATNDYENPSVQPVNVKVKGLVRWWTKSN